MPHPGIIDLHAHYIPEELVDRVQRGDTVWDMQGRMSEDGLVLSVRGRDFLCPRPGIYRLSDRLADMDDMGVACQVLSALPPLFYHWAEPPLATRMVRLTNESMAEAVRSHPDRFLGFASVALSSPDAMPSARSAIKDLGLHGFAVGTGFRDEGIDGPTFRRLFALAADLDVPIFVHPHNVGTPVGLEDNYLINTIGNPMATTIALGRFVFSGVLDEFPNLKTVWAHLGGYIGIALSRLEHGARVRPEARRSGLSPTQVMDKVWVDALNHDVRAVKFAADLLGRDRVVMGTDYFADMGIDDPRGHIAALSSIDPPLADLVARGNAEMIFPSLGK